MRVEQASFAASWLLLLSCDETGELLLQPVAPESSTKMLDQQARLDVREGEGQIACDWQVRICEPVSDPIQTAPMPLQVRFATIATIARGTAESALWWD
jgi:hypothetical protein